MATDPVVKWAQYAKDWKGLHGKLKQDTITGADTLWHKVKQIDGTIEGLEAKFKKVLPEAHEKGVAAPKLTEQEKHREVADVLKDFEKQRIDLEKAINALDAYCAACYKAGNYKAGNEVFTFTVPLSKHLRKYPAKPQDGSATKA